MPKIPDATRVSYATLLAAYLSADPSDRGIYAQHVVERLLGDDVFARLAGLRDELQARLDDEGRDRQLAVEYALDVLDTIVGAEP